MPGRRPGCQLPLPPAPYSPAFWTAGASTFKGNDTAAFDQFTAPYPERATSAGGVGWKCGRGTRAGINFPAAGFQTLGKKVRATGATNVLVLAGLAYSNELTRTVASTPTTVST